APRPERSGIDLHVWPAVEPPTPSADVSDAAPRLLPGAPHLANHPAGAVGTVGGGRRRLSALPQQRTRPLAARCHRLRSLLPGRRRRLPDGPEVAPCAPRLPLAPDDPRRPQRLPGFRAPAEWVGGLPAARLERPFLCPNPAGVAQGRCQMDCDLFLRDLSKQYRHPVVRLPGVRPL